MTLIFFTVKVYMVFFPGFSQGHIATFFEKLENVWSDTKIRMQGARDKKAFQKDAKVVIVAIDEKSLRMEDLGMWPWPRAKIAKMIQNLNECGAKVIGFDVIFSEPDSTHVVPVVEDIRAKYKKAAKQDPQFEQELEKIAVQTNGDKILAQVLEDTENVILGYFFFTQEKDIENLDKAEIQEGKDRIGFGTIQWTVPYPGTRLENIFPVALGVRANLKILTEATEHYGYFNQIPDTDSIFRKVPMVFAMKSGDPLSPLTAFPSLSLKTLATYYGQPVELFVNTIDQKEELPQFVGLYIGPLERPTDKHIEVPVEADGQFRVKYYGAGKTFKHVSAGDIIHRDEQACKDVKDKVVMVGSTAMAVYDLRPTPFETGFPGVEIHASVVENVLKQDFLLRPYNLLIWEAWCILIAGILFSWMLNRFRFTIGASVTAMALLFLLGADYLLLFKEGLLAHVVLPVIFLAILLVGIAVYRYMTEEREKSRIRHAFQFYLSGSVIDSMLHDLSKLRLGGERRELTVLFSDIRGFTTISEGLPPEKLTELLNEYLTPMTDLVFKYNGTLDKYMGDAIMAFFGAPVHFEDHARAACRTALEMMAKLSQMQDSWLERGLPQIDIGIGINTGPMSVGNMGSANRFDYTVMGDHVNLGSRLEGTNKQYGTHIIISEYTRSIIGDHFTCRELDAVQVKGKHEPVRIFELVHAGPPEAEPDKWIEKFHQALSAYKSRKWDEAVAGFEELPDDSVARLYVQRCKEMNANPPGADWDGVFKMTTK